MDYYSRTLRNHTANIVELLLHHQYCLKMCGSGCICLWNWRFLKLIHDSHPIKSSDNSSHMIPSPYTPSNPQIITQQITPHPSTSTHLVLHQSTAPKPTRIPLALKHLASQNKPSLQEPWFSVTTSFCYFVQHDIDIGFTNWWGRNNLKNTVTQKLYTFVSL